MDASVGRLLRERTYVTRLLVLRAFNEDPRTTFREVGEELDVSVQAVSTYVKALAEERLLEAREGGWAPTPAGLAELQEGFTRLKRAVDEALAPLVVVGVTSAVAETRVAPGDEVGLFMQAGILVARAGAASGSRGRAATPAAAGEEVVVQDLEGVVALRPGRLALLKVPAPVEGGSRRVPPKKVRSLLEKEGLDGARVGAYGSGAVVLARLAGREPDFVFGALEASFNAAELGLDVALFVTRDLLRDALARLDALNAGTLRRVAIDLLDLPVEGASPLAGARRAGPGRRRR